jgi:hypothetical protein
MISRWLGEEKHPCIYKSGGSQKCRMLPEEVCSQIPNSKFQTQYDTCAEATNAAKRQQGLPKWALILLLTLIGLLVLCVLGYVIWLVGANSAREEAAEPFKGKPVHHHGDHHHHTDPSSVVSGPSSSSPTQIIMQAPPYPWPGATGTSLHTPPAMTTPVLTTPSSESKRTMDELEALITETQQLQSKVNAFKSNIEHT